MAERNIKVFVYGTLKEGFTFHDEFLGEANNLGPAKTNNEFSLYITYLPFLVREDSDAPVEGELYEISEKELYDMDTLEGHPNFYKREIIEVTDSKGDKVKAWAYLHPNVFKNRKGIKEYKYD